MTAHTGKPIKKPNIGIFAKKEGKKHKNSLKQYAPMVNIIMTYRLLSSV
jgi:hypothetical protein